MSHPITAFDVHKIEGAGWKIVGQTLAASNQMQPLCRYSDSPGFSLSFPGENDIALAAEASWNTRVL